MQPEGNRQTMQRLHAVKGLTAVWIWQLYGTHLKQRSLVAAVVAASWPPQLHVSAGHLDVGGSLKQVCSAAAAQQRLANAVLGVLVLACVRYALLPQLFNIAADTGAQVSRGYQSRGSVAVGR
jgi:hypothetical protein